MREEKGTGVHFQDLAAPVPIPALGPLGAPFTQDELQLLDSAADPGPADSAFPPRARGPASSPRHWSDSHSCLFLPSTGRQQHCVSTQPHPGWNPGVRGRWEGTASSSQPSRAQTRPRPSKSRPQVHGQLTFRIVHCVLWQFTCCLLGFIV